MHCAYQINSGLLFKRGGVLIFNIMHVTFLICFISFCGDSPLPHIPVCQIENEYLQNCSYSKNKLTRKVGEFGNLSPRPHGTLSELERLGILA